MIRLAILAGVLVTGPGCFSLSLGGGSSIDRTLNPPTLGEEFKALHRAHASGTLDDEDYAEARQRLVANQGTR